METKMKQTKCYSCGESAMSAQNLKGSFFPFRDFVKVEVKHDLLMSKCAACGELSASSSDLRKLDEHLEYSISSEMRGFVKTILANISITQKDFASKVGLSEQYISNLKKGVKFPSAQIFNFFKVMAETDTALDVLGIQRTKILPDFNAMIKSLQVQIKTPVAITISHKEASSNTPYMGYENLKKRYMSIHDVHFKDENIDNDDSQELEYPGAA